MTRPVRVLVVDDHPFVRRTLVEFLQSQEAFEVVGEADSGYRCLEVAAEVEPDLVLMDYSMPGMNGAEATRALLEARPEVAVIAVTNDERPSVRHAMERAGADGFFLKGTDPGALVSMMRKVASWDAAQTPSRFR